MQTFDADYFERYYEQRKTRVYGPEQVAELARGVLGMIRWLGGKVETVLDVGAGPGFWGRHLHEHEPRVRYTSIDGSPYACARYGHLLADISQWRSTQKFDLVVCQGVLPYLGDDEALAAIENMAAMCGGFLYLECITTADMDEVCGNKTDFRVARRSGAFYRKALRPHFVQLGVGLFYTRRGELLFYELERAEA